MRCADAPGLTRLQTAKTLSKETTKRMFLLFFRSATFSNILFVITDEVVEDQTSVPVVKPDPNKANPKMGIGQVSFSCDSRFFFTKNGTV